jgi:hypothetical protein
MSDATVVAVNKVELLKLAEEYVCWIDLYARLRLK